MFRHDLLIRFASCLLAGVLLAGAAPAGDGSADDGPAGSWRGIVTLAAGEVEVLVALDQGAGGWSGTLTAPALELAGVELSEIEVGEGRVAFTVAGLGNGVRLSGELGAGGERIRGEAAESPPPAPPATDIFLFAIDDFDAWAPAPPLRITDRDGYDNQPHFLADGSGILYTSIRDGQADIYRYDLADRSTTRVTDTPESEYSPTPVPGGDRFSAVRVEADGTQRLWSFTLAGTDPALVLAEVQPVGYHAWVGDGTLALFVLGDPNTLRLADVASGEAREVASGIGRSLHAVPGRGHLSFVHKVSADDWRVAIFDPWMDRLTEVIATRPGSEDLTWTADGRILMGERARLYTHDPTTHDPSAAPIEGGRGWVEVADLEVLGVRGITRLSLSPDNRRLAVVGERPPTPPPSPEPRPFELERQ